MDSLTVIKITRRKNFIELREYTFDCFSPQNTEVDIEIDKKFTNTQLDFHASDIPITVIS